jgi:hypothetical protein
MRGTLAKAGLALFTVGTMAIARPGLAQTSPYPPLGPSARTNSSRDDGPSAGRRQAAPEEVRIELAWMADPATFPCYLGVYRDGNALKVRGFVPSEAVRARAIQIAGEQSGMTVVDELRINSNMPMRAVDGTRTAREKETPPAVIKPVSPGVKTVVLSPSESKPRVAPLSESADAWSGPKVLTLPQRVNSSVAPLSESGDPKVPNPKAATPPESRITPAATAKDKPIPSGGVPTVVDHTPRTKAPGAGVTFADARSTDKPSNKVELVGAKSAPAAKTPALADGSYVSPGVISYEDPSSSPAAPAPYGDPFASRLRERIDAICGGAEKNVEIQTTGEKRLLIWVQCATREEGERLSRRILQLRELAPYEVSLHIKLVP